MRDPFPEVNGGGLALLEAAGLAVEIGCEAEPARALNAPYLKRLTTGLPFVTAKWAMTLDGKTAVSLRRQPLDLVGVCRGSWSTSCGGRMDAIVVGIGTVVADDPLLTARPPGPRMSGAGRARQRGAAAGLEPTGPDGRRVPGPGRGHRPSDRRATATELARARLRSRRFSGIAVGSRSCPCSRSWAGAA